MSTFTAATLNSDPDGLALLAAILHPTKEAQEEAVTRGRERLARATSASEAMARVPRWEAGCCAVD